LAITEARVVFPSPGRSVQENVIEGFASLARGLNGDLEVLFDIVLTDVFAEPPGTQR
jgi:hypothetical protein